MYKLPKKYSWTMVVKNLLTTSDNASLEIIICGCHTNIFLLLMDFLKREGLGMNGCTGSQRYPAMMYSITFGQLNVTKVLDCWSTHSLHSGEADDHHPLICEFRINATGRLILKVSAPNHTFPGVNGVVGYTVTWRLLHM